MKIKEQLQAASEKRKSLIAAMEALVAKSEEENRVLTDEETATFTEVKSQIGDADARIARLEEVEKLIGTTADPVVAKDENDAVRGPLIKVDTKKQKVKGAFFAKQAHLLFLAQGNTSVAADLAEKAGDKEMGAVLRAAAAGATSTTSGWASQLVAEETQDFIDLLRPMSVYSRMPAGSSLSFDGTNSIKLPKMSTGTPGGFVSEAGAIPVKAGAFTSVTITPSKLGVITVATREVLSRSTPALETILRDSMLRDTAITLDRRFLCATAAGSGAPSGLFHTDNAPAAITASNVSNAADDAIADLKAMLQAMYAGGVPMNNLVWLMHSSKKLDLMALRAATGSFYFRDELVSGTLMGYPVLDSAVFDKGINDGSTTNIRTVALVDASLLVKGTGLAPTLALSSEATLHMDDAPNADILVPASGGRSLFQTDSVALRLTWETTWRMRHTVGVQYVNGVNW